MQEKPILIVRLGAMGDIIHALPAVASLRLSFPKRRIVWVAARKWLPILEGNPNLDAVIPFERNSVSELSATWKRLRAIHPGLAIDFQGLIQSAMAGRVASPDEFIGLDKTLAREPAASSVLHQTGQCRWTAPRRTLPTVGDRSWRHKPHRRSMAPCWHSRRRFANDAVRPSQSVCWLGEQAMAD